MRAVSPRVRNIVEARPQVCARRADGGCAGRTTWEHALIYAGKQVDEAWAIVILCERHHSVGAYQDCGALDKRENERLALNQATDEELREYSKAVDYIAMRDRLNNAKVQEQKD